QEERAAVGSLHEAGPCLAYVLLHPADRALADRHVAVLASLALADPHQTTTRAEIDQEERGGFGSAHASRIEQLQDGAVPEPLARGEVVPAPRGAAPGGPGAPRAWRGPARGGPSPPRSPRG